MGTPDLLLIVLILFTNQIMIYVVTTPDKKAGRGQKMKESAVKRYCISNCIKLYSRLLSMMKFLSMTQKF